MCYKVKQALLSILRPGHQTNRHCPCPPGAAILVEETHNKHTNRYIRCHERFAEENKAELEDTVMGVTRLDH